MKHENLQSFLKMTNQYAQDVDDVYNEYVDERDELAEAGDIDGIIKATEEFKDELVRLSVEYLKNVKMFKEGEHPEQQ